MVHGFLINTKPQVKSFNFNGDIKPTGYFDPMHLSDNSDERTLKYLREAELHHGRIAMVSALVLPLLDVVNKDQLAIDVLTHSGKTNNLSALGAMGIFETSRMFRIYNKPWERVFSLKDQNEPGQLNPYYEFNENLSNKELSNGRLAMLGSLGYIAQELVTQHKIF